MSPTWRVKNDWVKENRFLTQSPARAPLPQWETFRASLPRPFWEGHDDAIACYWKVWELAHKNLKPATAENNFLANYIDTAFNNHTFLWDSVFMLSFGRYGSRAFDFQRTLDNFYRNQEGDGFIGREYHNDTGQSRWQSFDPNATGPNLFAWSEWENWLHTGDRERLEKVFPVLMAYHEWTRLFRTWQDGTYWNCGFGAGMDNQPRIERQDLRKHHHGFMSWVDATLQALLSADLLVKMGNELGRPADVKGLELERKALLQLVNEKMWNPKTQFYHDLARDGKFVPVKTIGAYWALLAQAVPQSRLKPFLAHLENKKEFNRPHRCPSLSADHPEYNYNGGGGYWCGAVWPNTNYMLLRGLTDCGEDRLAHEIAMNHLENITEVFRQTGTVFENYDPEAPRAGKPAKSDFVGWGGIGPVAVLFEYALGLRADVPHQTLLWDVRLTEAHGVENYPFGKEGLLQLSCQKRGSSQDEPGVTLSSNIPVKIIVCWDGKRKSYQVDSTGCVLLPSAEKKTPNSRKKL